MATTLVQLTLPPYPSSQTRSKIPVSKLLSLNQKIGQTLENVIVNLSSSSSYSSQQTSRKRANVTAGGGARAGAGQPGGLKGEAARFIESYVRDKAVDKLESIVWDVSGDEEGKQEKMKEMSRDEKIIHDKTLQLGWRIVKDWAEGLPVASAKASSNTASNANIRPPLDLQTLVDLAIVYASPPSPYSTASSYGTFPVLVKKTKELFALAFTEENEHGRSVDNKLVKDLEEDLIPAFVRLLSASTNTTSGAPPASQSGQPPVAAQYGLYGLRKIATCVISFLRVAPLKVVVRFAKDRRFMVALARVYDDGLNNVARNYGGTGRIYAILQGRDLTATSQTGRAVGATAIHMFASSSASLGAVLLEDWQKLWLETKIVLIDSFHLMFNTMMEDVTKKAAEGTNDNALQAEHRRFLLATLEVTFDIIFELLDLPSSLTSAVDSFAGSSATGQQPPPLTPFLNQSLLTDYQNCYDLSQTLNKISQKVQKEKEERDARLDILEYRLKALEGDIPADAGKSGGKDPGVLRLVLRSSGAPPGIDNLGRGTKSHLRRSEETSTGDKGKGRAPSPLPIPAADSEIDIKITQVLDILSDYSPDYIRALLTNDSHPFKGNPERVIAALLDGTAPSEEELARATVPPAATGKTGDVSSTGRIREGDIWNAPAESYDTGKGKDIYGGGGGEHVFTRTRHNVFDEEQVDMSLFRYKSVRYVFDSITRSDGMLMIQDTQYNRAEALEDRQFIEQMKADILRRAQEVSSDEEEDDTGKGPKPPTGRDGGSDTDTENEVIRGTINKVTIGGDGEDTDESNDDEPAPTKEQSNKPPSMEMILELAYIKDPSLFERDMKTRRSKARQDLKAQTGWADEQIEGWRIMLERNVSGFHFRFDILFCLCAVNAHGFGDSGFVAQERQNPCET